MPTHHRGPRDEVLALDTFVKLSRAIETVGARLQEGLAEHGITMRQLGVLEALLHLGPMSQRQLGRKLLRGDPNMTGVLDTLERDGLIRRQRSPEDRRVMQVSLTPEGLRLIERVFPAHAQRITAAFGALSEAEQKQLGELCKKLGLANAHAAPAQSIKGGM